MSKIKSGEWTEEITPFNSVFDIRLNEVIRYKDLLFLLVRRDIVATYKQTVLGPLWFFIQPLLTTMVFYLVFSRIAGISTHSVPPVLFYLSGLILWNYFAECLNKTATVFKDNAGVFGKVYFPRLIMPLSIVISNLIRFSIQLLLLIIVIFFYSFNGYAIKVNVFIVAFPILIFLMAIIALGLGMLISALTTKYRDLIFLLSFGVQLLMYATPVIYPMEGLPLNIRKLIEFNPLSSIIESFRYIFTGVGTWDWSNLTYSFAFAIILLTLGIVIFNRVEKTFMDTV